MNEAIFVQAQYMTFTEMRFLLVENFNQY